jgi:hypothetical protein
MKGSGMANGRAVSDAASKHLAIKNDPTESFASLSAQETCTQLSSTRESCSSAAPAYHLALGVDGICPVGRPSEGTEILHATLNVPDEGTKVEGGVE